MTTLPPEIYEQDKCTFFALGRNAMYAACQSLGLGEGDIVLTPVFDCDSTLNPYRVLNLSLDFYKSDPYTFEVDVTDIKKRINKNVKLVHIINHFGFPQPWDAILKLCEETGIPIIEDNAYTLSSKYKGRMLGTFGDFSFFSLYKMIPMIDGAMLRINNPQYSLDISMDKPKWFYPPDWKKVFSLVAVKMGYEYLPDAIKMRILKAEKPLPPLYSDKSGYPEWHLRDAILSNFSYDYYRPMSRIARYQMSNFLRNDRMVLEKNIRRYYRQIVNRLTGVKRLKVLWPIITDEQVPTCVSVLIRSHRDEVLYGLKAKKYAVIAWPTYSGAVIDRGLEFPEIEIIGKQILQLMIPAHRVLKPTADSYFMSLVRDFITLHKRFD
ncbi:MAG: DegT/DnrJ/EryC1/StrS family aminotransferase [Candidatus Marinimicrobia bacterium]|nr:DegT/DnrJ/EryC1/StrS family aminotransferase [Candidatus Neomarinimicrobiota bacterium]